MDETEAQMVPAPLGPVERVVGRAVRVARWVLVMLPRVLLWGCGLVLLGVQADLPQWRYISGAALLALACCSFWRA